MNSSRQPGTIPEPILLIPHYCSDTIKVRTLELARALSIRHRAFYLEWESYPLSGSNGATKLAQRMRTDISNILRLTSQRQEGQLVRLRTPLLQSSIATRMGAGNLVPRVNQLFIDRLVRRFGIRTIVNSSDMLFSVDSAWPGLYIYDVVDDTIGENRSFYERLAFSTIRRESQKAQVVTTISLTLREKLNTLLGVDAQYLPNGALLKSFESVTEAQIAALRQRLELHGRYVIGYIGNHTTFAGLHLLTESFQRLRREMPDAVLLVAGPVSPPNREYLNHPGIVCTGAISPDEVAVYFRAIDVGVLSFVKSPLTDGALPLKIIEYGAARKLVAATALDELQRLSLPYVRLLPEDPDRWVDALVQSRKEHWLPEWDKRVAAFDWSTIADRLPSMIQGVAPAPEKYQCST